MDVLILATSIAALASGYAAGPSIRRAVELRVRRVPPLPKRRLPPPLPRSAAPARAGQGGGLDLLQLARRRQYEALGVSETFLPPGQWWSAV
ncbi:hypothetical protein [Rhodanobacter thiooxydans]|uniref:hypothetical protein n=1 Tax=Rhodanobacter thiooxydans TaxID=416169 RepID=UPI000AA53BE2|nr:hypothetical protein [Rhodanobacter thiooxydans]UJJ56694.1 hypothetical protein LRK53_18975 [Rhodanobacter thiooxydans]